MKRSGALGFTDDDAPTPDEVLKRIVERQTVLPDNVVPLLRCTALNCLRCCQCLGWKCRALAAHLRHLVAIVSLARLGHHRKVTCRLTLVLARTLHPVVNSLSLWWHPHASRHPHGQHSG
jgi:hypothetical protein